MVLRNVGRMGRIWFGEVVHLIVLVCDIFLPSCNSMHTASATAAAAAANRIPLTMRCVVYGTSEPHIAIVPTPTPGQQRNHVLVRVVAAGLNPVDAKHIVGDKLPETWTFGRQRVRSYIADKIPGFDFSGICMEDAHGFGHGDKVFGTMPPFHGTLAEYISVPLDQICYMPKNYSFAQAAALPLVG